MTIFDTDTDRFLDELGAAEAGMDWDDVLFRARRRERRTRRARAAAVGGAAVTTAAVAVALLGSVGGDSIVTRAEASVLAPVRAADGTIEHVLQQYRTDSGEPFIEYETWIAADGAWCRRTVEGVPGARVADTRLTKCRSADGAVAIHLPAADQILRTGPGQAVQEQATDQGPAPDWLREDVVEAFRRDAVREDGTMDLDGRTYAKLVTRDGRHAILVDPETGEAHAWIPPADAFGVPTIVVRTRETIPDDARSRRSLSLTAQHPNAVVRDVTPTELNRAIEAQYPRG
jgi:hypothetical protein